MNGEATPNLAFLIGREIEWFESTKEGCEKGYHTFCVYSGHIIEAFSKSILVQTEDKPVCLDAHLLAFQATEDCIRKFMLKVLLGPSSKALLDDATPHDIYRLKDPIYHDIRYIGMSKDAKKRYKQHIHADKNIAKSSWIQGLRVQGLLPELEIIERINGKFQALCHEEYWIHYYAENGAKLTNFEDTYIESE